MFYITLGLFALAAFVGLLVLKNWLTAATTSRAVVYTHGIFAATALVLLLVQVIRNSASGLRTSLVFFVAAALGGFYLFFRDRQGKVSPTWMVFAHAAVAVTGFVLLLLVVL